MSSATGAVSGTARFESASGAVTLIDPNRLFAFTICGGGTFLMQNNSNLNTAPRQLFASHS